jgi:WD40 repeat protein
MKLFNILFITALCTILTGMPTFAMQSGKEKASEKQNKAWDLRNAQTISDSTRALGICLAEIKPISDVNPISSPQPNTADDDSLGIIPGFDGIIPDLHNIIFDYLREWKVAHTLEGHTDKICSVAFSPDGTRIVTGSMDNTAKIWDIQDINNVACIATLQGHNWIKSVAFNPTGTRVVTGLWDRTAKIWDIQDINNVACIATLQGHTSDITSVAFNPDGTQIVTGSGDRTAKLWKLISEQEEHLRKTPAERLAALREIEKIKHHAITKNGEKS